MKKRILFLIFILFFAFPLMTSPKEKKSIIVEHLIWKETGYFNFITVEIADPNIKERKEAPEFLRFHVPPSPKSDTLFFEFWAQAFYKLGAYPLRNAECGIWFQIESEIIPTNIMVRNGFHLLHIVETNNALNEDLEWRRAQRNLKLLMNANNISYWIITYKDSGEFVSEEYAKNLINQLIRNGFDVKVYAYTELQGVTEFFFYPIFVEVTRLIKNDSD